MVATMFLITSCDDYLDINDNPNQATAVSADLVLPQALVATALVLNAYNSYGMQIGGYAANAGGYGGFNETVSYLYTPNNYANLWPATYDNLEDYQYIINQTNEDDEFIYYNAVARIMRAYGFQLLVDTYNNVPYTDALQGSDLLTPTYEDAATIYVKLADELDAAMASINTGLGFAVSPKSLGDNDVVFGGDMTNWLKTANTIKLRLIIRARGKASFSNENFDPAGFLDTDALINPGYTRDNNRQNPAWNSWGFTYNGSSGNKAWIPTTFIMTFYNNIRLNDPDRGAAMYYQFPATGTNQLGFESTGIPKSPEGSFWYPSDQRTGTQAGDATGPLKGPDAGYPLLTAAESYFLQAEAKVVGIASVPGDAKELFEAGITASFNYTYMHPDGSIEGDPEADAADYIARNNTYLTQFDQAVTPAQQIEAIITQKYIALNMVNSHEGWNEYRRTGYPKVQGISATGTFASSASALSTRPDRLPTRILYPTSEIQYNPENVPQGVTSSNSFIFWAKQN